MSAQQNFAAVFPEGLTPLAQADPEVFAIIKDEEERQWCVALPLLLPAHSGLCSGVGVLTPWRGSPLAQHECSEQRIKAM